MYAYRNIKVRSRNNALEKQQIFVCVYKHAHVRVALLTQHATRWRHIVTSFVVPLAPPYFSTSYKRHDFRKKVPQHKMCVSILSTTFV